MSGKQKKNSKVDQNADRSKKWMDKYHNDPEFKEKHIKRLTTKVECECGRKVLHGYMAIHRKKAIHTRAMEVKEHANKQISKDDLLKQLKQIQDCVKQLQKNLLEVKIEGEKIKN